MNTLYLEYRIIKDRPGLLGDVASLLGLLDINIKKVSSLEENRRGFLLEIPDNKEEKNLLENLKSTSELEQVVLRKPCLEDFLALKHGKKLSLRYDGNKYCFSRTELELLLDFLSHYISSNSYAKIGLKGAPKIGKTETAIAAAVHANKQWRLLSTTLLRKIAVEKLPSEDIRSDTVFIVDAITTFYRSSAAHIRCIKKFIEEAESTVIIEHPRVFVEESSCSADIFDVQIELTSHRLDGEENKINDYIKSFNSFDIS